MTYNMPDLVDQARITLGCVQRFVQAENTRREVEHSLRVQEAERRREEIRPC